MFYSVLGSYIISGEPILFASHPDLLKMQCDLGSEQSYQKSQDMFEQKNGRKRKVNNRSNIARVTQKFGNAMSDIKSHPEKVKPGENTDILVAQVDGGHIKANLKNKRSYEVLTGRVYSHSNVVERNNKRRHIKASTYVASAKVDRQSTIKKQMLYASLKEGMSDSTITYVLADGAKNCWSAVSLLRTRCSHVINILDWCHIGRKFKNAEQILPESHHEQLEKAKWSLWHGNHEKCMTKLDLIYDELTKTDMDLTKLVKLQGYLHNNENYIINYYEQKKNKLPFSSSVIECAVDNIINERQNRTRKMQWTRDGAHPVAQLRASKASCSWDEDWNKALEYLLAA